MSSCHCNADHLRKTRATHRSLQARADERVGGQIHEPMPVLIAAESHDRWLANIEPDPRDLLAVLLGANERASSELMKTSPISTRVNKPDDDTHLLTPVPAIFSRQNMKRPDLHTGKPGRFTWRLHGARGTLAPVGLTGTMPPRLLRATTVANALKNRVAALAFLALTLNVSAVAYSVCCDGGHRKRLACAWPRLVSVADGQGARRWAARVVPSPTRQAWCHGFT